MKIDILDSELRAAPGDTATCRVRIGNDGTMPQSYTLRVVGWDAPDVDIVPATGTLGAGAVADAEVRFTIPEPFAAGRHSVAIEAVAGDATVRPAIDVATVEVGTVEHVALAVVPSRMRGRRRARFKVDIDSRATETTELELRGEGPGLDITIRPDRLRIAPGSRVRVKGRAKGPRHIMGDPVQHSLSVVARSRSAPRYAAATFQQRPLIPGPLRTTLAIVLVVALWAGALGGGYYWWNQMQEDEQAQQTAGAALVDTDGDGIPDTPGDELVDTNGDGVGDTPAADVAAAGGTGDGGDQDESGAGDEAAATTAVVGGKVVAGETGDDSDVAVTLTPVDLNEPSSPDADTSAGARQSAEASPDVAGWGVPNRASRSQSSRANPTRSNPRQTGGDRASLLQPAQRETVSIESTATGDDGAWLFSDVAIGRQYEVHFAKVGFDSQSFVIEPPADGSPVELEVELEPATGSLSGVVTGPGGGGLGNVAIEVTDGTLTYTTSTGSDPDNAGAWSLSGISTPGTYTLTAGLSGYGTEVVQITMDAGDQQDGIDVSMARGVGSIVGRVTADGARLGGASITATDGDTTYTTTSLTDGDTGLFSFPQLEIPAQYTVTVSLDGYITQTRLVDLDGNATGVNVALSKTTAAITGIVVSRRSGPLPGAHIEVQGDELQFSSESAAAPDAGSFAMTDLPPGTYRIEFARHDHRARSRVVTVGAGEVKDLGRIRLAFGQQSALDQTGSLTVRVVDSTDTDLTGATVNLIDIGTGDTVATLPDRDDPGSSADQATFVFEPVDVGTYLVEVERPPRYRTSTRRVSVGLGEATVTIPLYQLGQASGRLIDSLTGEQLDDYEVAVMRVNGDGSETEVQRIVVPAGAPADDGPDNDQIRWETEANTLSTGFYRVAITDPPPGYLIRPDQNLVPDPDDRLDPMQFEIAADADDPIRIRDIQADIFPTLTGRVRAPRRNADGTVSLQPIDAADLRVRLRCGDGDPVRAPQVTDEVGLAGRDTYRFGPVFLQQRVLRGDCELLAGAAGYATTVVEVPQLQPTDGEAPPLYTVNVDMRIFPTLTGRIRVPELDGDGDVLFDPVDDETLAVLLRCGDGDAIPAPELFDSGGGPAIDSYRFDRVTLQTQQQTGSCTLTISADGYTDAVVSLPWPLRPTGEGTPTVRRANVALFHPTDVGGSVYWIDGGTGAHMPVGAATIRADGDVIVGFDPTHGPDSEPRPRVRDGVETTTAMGSDPEVAKGTWAFADPKQVFGTSEYAIARQHFETRSIAVTIDEDGRSAEPVDPPSGLTLSNDGSGIGIELDANGGTIRSDVRLLTVKGAGAYTDDAPHTGEFDIGFSGVDDQAAAYQPGTSDPRSGTAIVETDDPGTYRATIVEPDHHRVFPPSASDTNIEVFQAPGTDVTLPQRTYVELGRIDVTVHDGFGDFFDASQIDTVRLQQVESGRSTPEQTLDAEGEATFLDLPAHPETPLADPVHYRVTGLPQIPGYDVDGAVLAFTDRLIIDDDPNPCNTPSICEVPLRAGMEQHLDVEIQEYGSITGNVLGDLDADDDDDDRVALPVDGPLTVEATRVTDLNGNSVTGPTVEAQADGDGFIVSGPPGFYTFEIQHPNYQPLDDDNQPPSDDPDLDVGEQHVFAMRNLTDDSPSPNSIETPWVLNTKLNTLDLGIRATDGVSPIADAKISITDEGGTPITGSPFTTNDDGMPSGGIPEVPPGDYRIEIRKRDPNTNEDQYFPVMVTINLPQGDEDDERTRTVNAVLPRVGGALVGMVGAINSRDEPVPLPEISIDRAYDHPSPDVEVNAPGSGTTLVPNEATESDISPVPTPTVTVEDATGGPVQYRFDDLPLGVHTLTFSDETGYTTPHLPDQTVSSLTETTIDPVNYVAADRTVEVTVDASVEITWPDNGPYPVTLQRGAEEPLIPTVQSDTYTFAGVPPSLDAYTLTVDADLYGPETRSVAVTPGDPETAITEHVAQGHLDADLSGIVGTARKQPGAGSQQPVGPDDADNPQLTLIQMPAGIEVASTPDTWNADGSFLFTVDETGDYRLRLTLDGYATEETGDIAITSLGQQQQQDIAAKAAATISITVDGPAPGDAELTEDNPASVEAITSTRDGNTFTLTVDPDYRYWFTASAPGFISERVPGTGNINPNPGQTINPDDVELDERTLGGTVAPEMAGVEVKASDGTVTLETTTDDDGEYSFEGVDGGTWTVVAEELGVGRGTAEETFDDTDGDQDVDISLAPRPVPLEFSTAPPGATIVLTDPEDVDIMTGTEGVDEFAALEDQFPVTWTATLDGHDQQTGEVALDITGDTFDLTELPAITVDEITLPTTPTTTTTTTPTTTTPPTTTASTTTAPATSGPP